HLIGAKAKQRPGRSRGSECRHGPRWMKEIVVTRIDGFTNTKRSLVSNRDRGKKRATAGMLTFGDCQCGWNDRRRGMDGRALVDVVEFENVRRDAIGKCRCRG